MKIPEIHLTYNFYDDRFYIYKGEDYVLDTSSVSYAMESFNYIIKKITEEKR
jgi:hypothetical protein